MIPGLQKINPPLAHEIDDAMLLRQPTRPATLQLGPVCFKGFDMPVKKVYLSYQSYVLQQIDSHNETINFLDKQLDYYLSSTGKRSDELASNSSRRIDDIKKKIQKLETELSEKLPASQNEPTSFFDEQKTSRGDYLRQLYVYQDVVYEITKIQSDEENKLLILEFVDKERRKFEQLKNKFSGTEPEELKYLRTRIPESVRIAVWRRDQGKCAKCGGRENLEYDHIVPVSKGGGNTERNFELLCQNCNRSKGNRIE
jgi:vacuolar-type H+-ATPase subunit I/STV1